MTREDAKHIVDVAFSVPQAVRRSGEDRTYHEDDIREAKEMAIQALSQEPCEDAVSRQAVEDKLVKMCDGLEEIFANIRMQNADESVCGLCEYDCPSPFECPGFETNECFRLSDEIRHKWQSTKDLPSITLKQKMGHWVKISPAGIYECSECGQNVMTGDIDAYRHCHGCGAKMAESEEECR